MYSIFPGQDSCSQEAVSLKYLKQNIKRATEYNPRGRSPSRKANILQKSIWHIYANRIQTQILIQIQTQIQKQTQIQIQIWKEPHHTILREEVPEGPIYSKNVSDIDIDIWLIEDLARDPKSPNFPVGRISRAKTFQTERVNRFREKNAPKVRISFFPT